MTSSEPDTIWSHFQNFQMSSKKQWHFWGQYWNFVYLAYSVWKCFQIYLKLSEYLLRHVTKFNMGHISAKIIGSSILHVSCWWSHCVNTGQHFLTHHRISTFPLKHLLYKIHESLWEYLGFRFLQVNLALPFCYHTSAKNRAKINATKQANLKNKLFPPLLYVQSLHKLHHQILA